MPLYYQAAIGCAVSLGVVLVHVALAVVSEPAHEYMERGYAHLAQAHMEAQSTARERILSLAIAAFKDAYQAEPVSPAVQAQALLGAAQAYVLVQSPRRVFPFLWQATPLQRAAKSLQQALVLQPDNAAAALLLGVVSWRQAGQATGQPADGYTRSTYYLNQAAGLGFPIALVPRSERHAHPCTGFGVEDTIVALRYVDARGVGRMDDLVGIYQAAASAPLCGTVVTERQAHALIVDTVTGALAPPGLLESLTTLPRPGQPPILTLRVRQGTQAQALHFTWDGAHFVRLPALP